MAMYSQKGEESFIFIRLDRAFVTTKPVSLWLGGRTNPDPAAVVIKHLTTSKDLQFDPQAFPNRFTILDFY